MKFVYIFYPFVQLRLVVDTVYHDNDNGTGHSNALELAPSLLTQRRVERLDIATSQQTLNITLYVKVTNILTWLVYNGVS